jgi:hypothetical protein
LRVSRCLLAYFAADLFPSRIDMEGAAFVRNEFKTVAGREPGVRLFQIMSLSLIVATSVPHGEFC